MFPPRPLAGAAAEYHRTLVGNSDRADPGRLDVATCRRSRPGNQHPRRPMRRLDPSRRIQEPVSIGTPSFRDVRLYFAAAGGRRVSVVVTQRAGRTTSRRRRMRKAIAGAAVLAFSCGELGGGTAFAGERGGNGKPTPINEYRANSICSFSGLDDMDFEAPVDPGVVQNWGSIPKDVPGLPGRHGRAPRRGVQRQPQRPARLTTSGFGLSGRGPSFGTGLFRATARQRSVDESSSGDSFPTGVTGAIARS